MRNNNVALLAFRKIFAVFLYGFFFLMGCASSNRSHEMISIEDSWTFVGNLEENKRYYNLLTYLATYIGTFNTDVAGRKLDFTDTNKLANILQNKKVDDPEGVLYILDDLSTIYTKRVVNFRSALIFNNMANEIYEEIDKKGINNIPLSNYFNPRRKLFYFFEQEKKVDSEVGKELRNIDKLNDWTQLETVFPKTFLDTVRLDDFIQIKQRIEDRKTYLNRKLGYQDEIEKKLHLKQNIGNFFEKVKYSQMIHSNPYYRNVHRINKMWRLYQEGIDIDLVELVRLCEETIRYKDQRNEKEIDSNNHILYRLGIAYLKLGKMEEGLLNTKLFFQNVNEIDDYNSNIYRERRKIIGNAIQEDKELSENIAVGIAIAATVASVAVVATQAVAAVGATYSTIAETQAVSESLMQTAITTTAAQLGTTMAVGTATYPIDSAALENTAKLSGLHSDLPLRLARYLDKFEQVELFTELAAAYEKTGKIKAAIDYYKEAIDFIEAQRTTIAAEHHKISFSAAKESSYRKLISLLLKKDRLDEAFRYIQRGKARAFLDILSNRNNLEFKTEADTSALRDMLDRQEQVSAVFSESGWKSSKTITDILSARASSLTPSPSKGITKPALNLLGGEKPISAQYAKDLTKSNFSIIEYYLTDNEVYIFLFDNGEMYVKEIELDSIVFSNVIENFVSGITTYQKNNVIERSSKYLYNLLIAPVRKHISKNRIYIMPHSVLYNVPIHALKGPRDYMIKDYAITYIPSSSVLHYMLKSSKGNKHQTALVFGNPTSDLEGSEKEALFIAGTFDKSDSRLLLKGNATESAFKRLATAYDVIHIASHAQYDNTNPLLSYILLAQDNVNDGRLEVTELYKTELNTDLVVLSSCKSGISKVLKGDEIIGLNRGFLYSGTTSVLSTLWSVYDEPTKFIMKSFHKHFKRAPKDVALQQAQLDTMRAYPEKYYWAPFILTGIHH